MKHFPAGAGPFGSERRGLVRAVDGVDLAVGAGETVGVVGESGCGKSTLARLLVGLLEPTAGVVRFEGRDLAGLSRRERREVRRRVQIVLQDPAGALDPRMTVGASVAEPLRVHGERRKVVAERVPVALGAVGLDPGLARRYPQELSGGQRQRVAIARALVLAPRVVVLDEPVSALDASVRAEVVNLLADLRDRLGLACVVVSHDLPVVRHLADRVAVMYLGRVVEEGPAGEVLDRPRHPYTAALVSAAPVPDPAAERARERIVLAGDPPSPVAPPSGCRFRTRCWLARERCAEEEPALELRAGPHPVACHFAGGDETWRSGPVAVVGGGVVGAARVAGSSPRPERVPGCARSVGEGGQGASWRPTLPALERARMLRVAAGSVRIASSVRPAEVPASTRYGPERDGTLTTTVPALEVASTSSGSVSKASSTLPALDRAWTRGQRRPRPSMRPALDVRRRPGPRRRRRPPSPRWRSARARRAPTRPAPRPRCCGPPRTCRAAPGGGSRPGPTAGGRRAGGGAAGGWCRRARGPWGSGRGARTTAAGSARRRGRRRRGSARSRSGRPGCGPRPGRPGGSGRRPWSSGG
ncbi:MAG: ABC transporter ATP-binding protein [Acidimicrobiia bacterium]|nr:ABC transporter ATP-binding protein [Acidimicrobiia bacterium]